MNILITGKPRSGKTTLIKKIIEELKLNAGGFYTLEIKKGEKREGFKIISLNGEEGILAHVNIGSPYKVSKYGVDLKNLEEIGVKSVLDAIEKKDIIVIDEIGKMELFSKKFRDAVLSALNSEKKVLATIMLKDNPFTSKIKKRDDVKLFYLSIENWNKVKKEIESYLIG